MKIFTVLKTGGEFTPEHVYAIRDMCDEFISKHKYKFCCLTDLPFMNCETFKLKNNWDSWWSKIELFKYAGPILYFDLDIIITNTIDEIIEKIKSHNFCSLKDQSPHRIGQINSSIMYWNSDLSSIYNYFSNNAIPIMNKYKKSGDQAYITSQINNIQYIQELLPGDVVSFKQNIDNGRLFDKSKHKIVFFHGKPRPWQQSVIQYKY
jgi:hypothetical protein